MKAGLVRFLWLWLPPLGIFLAGLHRAFLTGQADAWDWALPLSLLLVVVGALVVSRGWPMRVAMALASMGMALIFCRLASGQQPDGRGVAGLLALAGLSLATGACWRTLFGGGGRSRWPAQGRWVGAITAVGLPFLMALILWRGPPQLQPVADRPRLAIITALPLFWDEMGQSGPRDAPIVTVLRTRFQVEPLDDPLLLAPSGARLVLLAQPRAMTPAQLVALDDWVRGGGRAVVLADPMLRWLSALPLGDRRRPPAITLLGPLLAHWGFSPIAPATEREVRRFLPDGALVTLSGTVGENPWASRVVGCGRVTAVADADLLDDRLWLADARRPRDPRYWSAETPAVLARWLGADPIPPRHWMRSPGAVIAALRWSVMAGTGWAILATLLLGIGAGVGTTGTKGEDKLE